MRQLAKISVLVVVVFVAFLAVRLNAAHAMTVAYSPVITNSYYMNDYMYAQSDPATQLYRLGAADARNEIRQLQQQGMRCNAGQFPIYAIIDFGSPRATSIHNWTGNDVYYGTGKGQVTQVALAYANGWYQISYNCFKLKLIVGVSNSKICNSFIAVMPCDSAAGSNLAAAVDSVNQALRNARESWQVQALGGFDAETGPYFNSYASTYDFAIGYNQYLYAHHVAWNLVDFGDASPSNLFDWGTDTSQKIYNIAWGIGYDVPMPELYTVYLNRNWYNVAAQTAHSAAGKMQFGPMMVDGTCTTNYDVGMWRNFVAQNVAFMAPGVTTATYMEPLSYPSLPVGGSPWCTMPATAH